MLPCSSGFWEARPPGFLSHTGTYRVSLLLPQFGHGLLLVVYSSKSVSVSCSLSSSVSSSAPSFWASPSSATIVLRDSYQLPSFSNASVYCSTTLSRSRLQKSTPVDSHASLISCSCSTTAIHRRSLSFLLPLMRSPWWSTSGIESDCSTR